MTMRTPLKSVRALGSAKEGADHFWKQRITGLANVFLGVFLVWLIARLAGADHATVKSTMHNPFVSAALLALIASAAIHMRLGMQTIIEDYVHGSAKIALLLLNTFFSAGVALISFLAILKLSFGA